MIRFTLRQLEVFAAIAQGENVSRAAEGLAMSQSAASTSLAELERQAGRPLFDRMGKRLQLNETGRALLPRAREILDRAGEIEAVLTEQGGPGPLRIGASLTIGNYLGPSLVEHYQRRFPRGQVKLEVGNTSRIADRVAAFALDLALIEGESSDPDLEMIDWVGDELAVFCAPSHPLAGAGAVSIARLLEEWWVVREPGSGTRQTLDRALASHRAEWKIAMELEHTEAIKRMVEAGRTISSISRLALKDAFRNRRLVEVKVRDLDLRRRFYFLLHRQKFRTLGINTFMEICRSLAAGDRRSDEIAI